MRRAGRIDPGSGGGVFTGHRVFSSPAVTAFTSARLSFLVRPFTEGTVIAVSLAVESLPTVDAVLDAVVGVNGVDDGVDEAAPATPCGTAAASDRPAGGSSAAPGTDRASLLAAQASEAMRANDESMGIDEDLSKTYCISSTEGLLICGGGSRAGNS